MTPAQIKELAVKLKPYNYVVQRNWRNLPESITVENHDDLDLFCLDDHKGAIKTILQEYPMVDVRSNEDRYYPEVLGNQLLFMPEEYGGYKIPNKSSYYDALTYHNYLHKKDNPYAEELRRAFFDLYPKLRCVDDGVGYYE